MRAASVPTCTSRRTPAARQAAMTRSVPPTFTRSNSAGSPQSPSAAAAWKATSQPSAPARSPSPSSRLPLTGSAPRWRTRCSERSERARARTSQPSARRRSISAPPMNPEPPVTNAVGTGGNLPQRRPNRLVRLLVRRLPDHGGGPLEAAESLGERVGPQCALAVPKMGLLVAVRVADVREVDVEGRARRDGRVGACERRRKRLDVREAAVSHRVEVREVENRPDPVEPSRDGEHVLERAELVHPAHDLDPERHRAALALEALPHLGELLDHRVDGLLALAAEQVPGMDDDDLGAAGDRDARGVIEHPHRHAVLLVPFWPADDREERCVHGQDDALLAGELAEALGEVPVHPELAFEVDLAGAVAALEQQPDGRLRRLAGGQIRGTEAQDAHVLRVSQRHAKARSWRLCRMSVLPTARAVVPKEMT